MTPFPEVELVTLDRLEVALRNKNMKLLKEGSYKLHEKYHSGHKFEYLDKLQSIYYTVTSDSLIPSDIKELLCPTIKDILADGGINIEDSEYDEPVSQNRVSSLTQLSYNATNSTESTTSTATIEQTSEPEKLSAFDVFGAKRSEENASSYTQSPFDNESNTPFQEFKMPETTSNIDTNIDTSINNYSEAPKMNLNAVPEDVSEAPKEYLYTPEPSQTVETQQNLGLDELPKEEESVEPAPSFEFSEPAANLEQQPTNYSSTYENYQTESSSPTEEKLEDVAVFYCQDTTREKVKNIIRYRELISKIEDEHYSINEILHLISEINTQSNTNILELKNILDQLQINKNKVSLVTNSTSANLIGLMESGEYSYSLYEKEEDKQINLIPVFGLSNQFICSSCGEIYLDKEDKINPLVLQCPKCKNPMFPNFYTANNNEIQMNLEYYNNALMSLVNSTVWVVIHPILEDKVMTNLILGAAKLNTTLKQIYILDKDINIREDFKKKFIELKSDVNVNTNLNALEDFLNSIR